MEVMKFMKFDVEMYEVYKKLSLKYKMDIGLIEKKVENLFNMILAHENR